MGLAGRKKSGRGSVFVDEISSALIGSTLAEALCINKKLRFETVILRDERVVPYPELFPQCGGKGLALLVVATLKLIQNTKDVPSWAAPVDGGNWKGAWQHAIERYASKEQSPLAVGFAGPVVPHADLVGFQPHRFLAEVAHVQHRLLAKREPKIVPARICWQIHDWVMGAVTGIGESRNFGRKKIGQRRDGNKALGWCGSEVEAFRVGQDATAPCSEKVNNVMFDRTQRRDEQDEGQIATVKVEQVSPAKRCSQA